MFKPKFTKADIKKYLLQRMKQIDQAIVNRLTYVGESFVRNARTNHTYTDQSGNLTQSIGFMVLHNGQTKKESSVGPPQAKSFSAELKSKFITGYALIVFAGMEYAAAVESMGKDVLTASSIQAKNDLEKALNQLSNKLNKQQ